MNKIPNNSHQGPAVSAASGVNKIGFWPAKDCLLTLFYHSHSFRITNIIQLPKDPGEAIIFFKRDVHNPSPKFQLLNIFWTLIFFSP